MCGIAGFVSLTGRPADPQRLARMVETLDHRGPDDRGYFTEGPAAIGAARLSIIDVAGGHQPISIDGGGITVAQNGEIYNYVELREQLAQSGRHTTTACDTEVIAHLYATEGVAGFKRMRGMFAIAIWDEPGNWPNECACMNCCSVCESGGSKDFGRYMATEESTPGTEGAVISRVCRAHPFPNWNRSESPSPS